MSCPTSWNSFFTCLGGWHLPSISFLPFSLPLVPGVWSLLSLIYNTKTSSSSLPEFQALDSSTKSWYNIFLCILSSVYSVSPWHAYQVSKLTDLPNSHFLRISHWITLTLWVNYDVFPYFLTYCSLSSACALPCTFPCKSKRQTSSLRWISYHFPISQHVFFFASLHLMCTKSKDKHCHCYTWPFPRRRGTMYASGAWRVHL